MTLPFRGNSRLPGPVGIYKEKTRGRLPGPVGGILWQKKENAPTAPATAKGGKKTVMPMPAKDGKTKDVRQVSWPLYNPKKNAPGFEEIKQASSLANCPVASILAAMASTVAGRKRIQGMLSETSSSVTTDVSGLPVDTLTNPPSGNAVASSRYFTVKLPSGSIDVSDVFYTDDADSGWSLIYMQDPSDQSIWGATIEKAMAVSLGGYENFDATNISANAFWKKITGVSPGTLAIDAKIQLSEIIDRAKASKTIPTIGASKPERKDVTRVTEFHGFAMLGMQGSKILLYDPAKAKTILLTAEEFRHDFQSILFQE